MYRILTNIFLIVAFPKDYFFFGVAFGSSILAASIGMAKTLRYGICRIIADSDAIDLFTGRFLMACLSCGLALLSKGFMIVTIMYKHVRFERFDENYTKLEVLQPQQLAEAVALCFGLFIPQLILAIWSSVGAKKSSLKMIIQHPSIILLPIYTFYTFSKINTINGDRDVRVKLSPLYTSINMFLSFGYGFMTIYFYFGFGFMLAKSIFAVFAIISTAIFLYYDSVFPCCCECCLLPPYQISVYDPDNPELELVWREGRVEEIVKQDGVQNEDVVTENYETEEEEKLEMVVVVDGGQTD